MHQRMQARALIRRLGQRRRDDLLRRRGMLDPARNRRHFVEPILAQDGFHRAAIGVPADHHILDAKRGHGVFDAGRNAACRRAVARDDVARVAHNEYIARLALRQHLGHDAAVRAGDEHRKRRLAPVLAASLPGQPMDFGLEAQRAFDQSVH